VLSVDDFLGETEEAEGDRADTHGVGERREDAVAPEGGLAEDAVQCVGDPRTQPRERSWQGESQRAEVVPAGHQDAPEEGNEQAYRLHLGDRLAEEDPGERSDEYGSSIEQDRGRGHRCQLDGIEVDGEEPGDADQAEGDEQGKVPEVDAESRAVGEKGEGN